MTPMALPIGWSRSAESFDVVAEDQPAMSLPACIEGTVYSKLQLKLESYPDSLPEAMRTEQVQSSSQQGFYADIHLDPHQTRIVRVTEALGQEPLEIHLNWATFNIYEHASLGIRLNDSLLLAAFDPEQATGDAIDLHLTAPDGTTETHPLSTGAELQARFDQAGQWRVSSHLPVIGEEDAHVEALIHVYAAELSPSPLVLSGMSRPWYPHVSDDRIRLSADPGVQLTEYMPQQPSAGYQLALSSDAQTIVARLPESDCILDSTVPRLLREQSSNQTHDQVVATFNDGSVMVRTFILLAEVPDDLELTLRIFKSGVSFEDGSLVRELTKADFDENGRYQFYMLRAPGVVGGSCHSARYHQGSETIGQL